MIYSLLAEGGNNTSWVLPVVLGVLLVLIIVWFVFSGRKNKARQKEYVEQLEAIRPGHKVKTAGGICGVVVEVCDDNTVIIETGSEQSGKSYIKMDKELIAQTDAKGPTQLAREEAEARRKAEKEGTALPAAEKTQEPAPETTEEPAPETAEEPAEEGDKKPAKKSLKKPVEDTKKPAETPDDIVEELRNSASSSDGEKK